MHFPMKLSLLQVLALPIALVSLAFSPVAAGVAPFWPQFHGAKGDNVSTDTGLLAKWPEVGPKLLWTVEGLGQGYASVSIDGERIYTAGDLGKLNVITAINMEGRVQWRFENGLSWLESVPGSRGTPAVARGRVYHENAHGSVVCLDAKTGHKIWGRSLPQEFGGRCGAWGYGDSLVVHGRRVICCPGGDTAMVALDVKTGKTVWKSPSSGEQAGYATPIFVEYRGLRMILTMSEKSLIGINADTGDLLWRFEHYNPSYVANCVMPIYHEGRIYISYGYGKGSVLLKINASGKTVAVQPVWRTENLDNRHGGVILLNGFIYGASQWTNKGRWACLEWDTGQLRYAEPGVGEGSLTCAEGMLYTLSEQRKVGLVKATPTGHELISQFDLPEGGGGPTWAHPVVCGGRLYIRHGDRLYAYDLRAK